jgi:hypothetical protein
VNGTDVGSGFLSDGLHTALAVIVGAAAPPVPPADAAEPPGAGAPATMAAAPAALAGCPADDAGAALVPAVATAFVPAAAFDVIVFAEDVMPVAPAAPRVPAAVPVGVISVGTACAPLIPLDATALGPRSPPHADVVSAMLHNAQCQLVLRTLISVNLPMHTK